MGRIIIIKFGAVGPKIYAVQVQKDECEIKNSEFKKANIAKNSAFKELTFGDLEKCVNGISNTPIIK